MEFNLVDKKDQHCLQKSLSNFYKIPSCALLFKCVLTSFRCTGIPYHFIHHHRKKHL